jgi:hypothetical protein
MSASLLLVCASGELRMNLCCMTGSERTERVRSLGTQLLADAFGVTVQRKANGRWSSVNLPDWSHRVTELLDWPERTCAVGRELVALLVIVSDRFARSGLPSLTQR